jgi:DNA adenine methylase Dam
MNTNNHFIEPPFNFTGSKYKLLNQIIPKFDYKQKNFIDLFAGGGSVWTNVIDKYDKIIANDIIEDLINIQKELITSDTIINDTINYCVKKDDKDGYNELRNNYNTNKTPSKLWALMLCCTNNMLRFNKKFNFNQTFGKRTYNINTEKKIKKYTEHIRQYKNKILFTSKSFNNIKIHKNTFYYIDPPYGFILNDNGEIGNKQISEAGYNNYYNKIDDINLYKYIHELNDNGATFMISGVLEHNDKISWILTKLINDGFYFEELDMNYNKVSKLKNDKKTKEIIITNYKIEN